jgi:hypothetical protein
MGFLLVPAWEKNFAECSIHRPKKQKHRPQSGVAVSFSREKSKERTQNS